MLQSICVRLVLVSIAVCGFALGNMSHAQAPGTTENPASPKNHRAVLDRYCVTCHNQRLKTADLMLDQVNPDQVNTAAMIWEKVARKLRSGQMPPAGVPRPDARSYSELAGYLEEELDRAYDRNPDPGRVPSFHRLNRAEYTNAIRDLLAIEVDGEALLPPDDSGFGFDTVAEMLTVSPLLIERYLAAAEQISRIAIGDPGTRPVLKSYKVPLRLIQDERMGEELPFGSRGGISVRYHFPLDGEYTIRVRLQRNNIDYIRGMAEPNLLDIRVDGVRAKLFRVGGEAKGRSGPLFTFTSPDSRGDPEREAYETLADADLEARVQVKSGMHRVGVSFLKENTAQEGVLMPQLVLSELESYKGGSAAVDSITIGGPYNARGMSEAANGSRIFVCRPAESSLASQRTCAGKILDNLIRLAFRRPPTKADLDTLLPFYRAGRDEVNFEEGIRVALKKLLTSPEFLFRIEKDPANLPSGGPYRISDLELASRLSFFLWSSIPDDQLLDLAERGKLKDPAMLRQQVQRMLADTRSGALVANFAGQWLYLRNLAAVSPDASIYPDYDENLTRSFRQETALLVLDMLRGDRSVLDLLRADYTFVNERLARHYGIPGVFGSHFRKVRLADVNRRGLLGQGSILTVTSYANRTAPTIRGKWILENILGTPPPPPPPDVPALPENSGGARLLSMRQRMEQHRVNPACASCHAKMDPLGFALENFDGVGRWRDKDSGVEINAVGVLADGRRFSGPRELQDILLQQPEQFVYTVTEKLLTYALGRKLEYYDAAVIRRIVRKAAANDYRWSSILTEVVESIPFQMRRAQTRNQIAAASKSSN